MLKPVYVFSGFLDSGKTTAIKNTLYDPRFNQGESTLIICIEQGDEEYDKKFLKATTSDVVYLDSFMDLTIDKQKELDKQYDPDRIFVEFNGMEDDNVFYQNGFIQNWELAQTLTTCDASKFQLHMQNMRQFMYNHMVNAEVAILNRADDVDKRYLRNNLKSINQYLEIIFEDKDGNVSNKIEDELFDVSHDLYIEDVDYGLWYMDQLDNPRKYNGKTVTIKVKKLDEIEGYPDVAIVGRRAMVCCANDIADIALPCEGVEKYRLKEDQYYLITAKISIAVDQQGYERCVLTATDILEAENIENDLVTFN
ncbi:MAG: GTP-binding protein [Erysipelotrichaceae bacterium]|nr:GTP-binding protein [Erysipelotrichaceae bacterium]